MIKLRMKLLKAWSNGKEKKAVKLQHKLLEAELKRKNNMSQIEKIQKELVELRYQQKVQKQECKRYQRRYDRLFGAAFFGDKGLFELSNRMQRTQYLTPREIRSREIALEFLKDGRFDRVERKFYYLDRPVDNGLIVLIDSDLSSQALDRAGHLWGKHSHQWFIIKSAMLLADWKDDSYFSYGCRWSLDDYRNSDNPFLRWIYRTHTGCDCVDFRKSSEIKTHRKTRYYTLYV